MTPSSSCILNNHLWSNVAFQPVQQVGMWWHAKNAQCDFCSGTWGMGFLSLKTCSNALVQWPRLLKGNQWCLSAMLVVHTRSGERRAPPWQSAWTNAQRTCRWKWPFSAECLALGLFQLSFFIRRPPTHTRWNRCWHHEPTTWLACACLIRVEIQVTKLNNHLWSNVAFQPVQQVGMWWHAKNAQCDFCSGTWGMGFLSLKTCPNALVQWLFLLSAWHLAFFSWIFCSKGIMSPPRGWHVLA